MTFIKDFESEITLTVHLHHPLQLVLHHGCQYKSIDILKWTSAFLLFLVVYWNAQLLFQNATLIFSVLCLIFKTSIRYDLSRARTLSIFCILMICIKVGLNWILFIFFSIVIVIMSSWTFGKCKVINMHLNDNSSFYLCDLNAASAKLFFPFLFHWIVIVRWLLFFILHPFFLSAFYLLVPSFHAIPSSHQISDISVSYGRCLDSAPHNAGCCCHSKKR